MSRSAWPPFLGALGIGMAAGWCWSRRHDRAHQRDLFAREPWRRFAALGWLAVQDDPEKIGLLHDYLAWETVPMLRQRGRRIMAVLERNG